MNADMVEQMKKRVTKSAEPGMELSVEERNLFSVAYKNMVGARRASWRILSSLEQKEESKGNDQTLKRIKEYRHKVESELSDICANIISLMDDHLILACSTGESTICFNKMSVD